MFKVLIKDCVNFEIFKSHLTEEFIHVAAFNGDVDIVGPDVVIVALRL